MADSTIALNSIVLTEVIILAEFDSVVFLSGRHAIADYTYEIDSGSGCKLSIWAAIHDSVGCHDSVVFDNNECFHTILIRPNQGISVSG